MNEKSVRPAADRPRVRPVEAFPVQANGRKRVALRDPAGWTDRVMIVTPETLFVVSCLDGSRTLRDVQAECFRRFQEIVPIDLLEGVVNSLDEALLLDSEAFRTHRAGVEAGFRASDVRPAAHAGAAYDGEAEPLRDRLARFLAVEGSEKATLPPGRVVALIAPHIDLHRGGGGYGPAYAALARRSRAGTFVVLGTAHAAPPEPYTATRKAYDTPLGRVEVDGEFIDRLAALYGPRLLADEIVHRSEHSIEFQALFLKHVFADRPVRIVPILCSSFHEVIEQRRTPRDDPRIAAFLGALSGALAERPDACLIAGADLAHLGPRFGDESPVGDETASWCEQRDRTTLEAAAAGDSSAFFNAVAAERDERRVCGVSAIYTLLAALPGGARGTLLHYAQALDRERTTFVSFASMAFTAGS